MVIRTFCLILLRIFEALLSLNLSIFFVLPTLLLLYVINSAARVGTSLRLRYCQGTKRVCLTNNGLDSIWGYKTNGNSRNVLNVVIYENQIDGIRYQRLFEERVLGKKNIKGEEVYNKLKKIFISFGGYYCWEEDLAFDIRNHVIITGEKVMGEEGLMELLGNLSEDMPSNHPQWQEVIVPAFQYDQRGQQPPVIRSIRILRFHHAYGDAGSWLLLYSHCMADGKIAHSVDPLKGYGMPSLEKYLYYASAIIFGSTTMIRNLWFGTNVRSNRLVTKKYSGRRSFAWTPPLDLQLLKDVKHQTKTSIPTVITCAIASALRRFDEIFSINKSVIGDIIDCGAVAAILPYPGLELTNRFTIANLSLPTSKGLTRVNRLTETHNSILHLTQSPEPILNFWTFSLFGLFPIFLQNFLMKSAGTSLVFSNLPGASRSFKLLGDKVESGGAWVPFLTCAGLTISAAGYRDSVRFCGASDNACMSKIQLQFILDTIVDEVNQMHQEINGAV